MAKRKPRVRQHANPFSFRGEIEVPAWDQVFADPTLPVEVDVGSAHGDFLRAWAAQRPDLNVVGLEVRRPMVERVNARIEQEGLGNARVIYCNANLNFSELFAPASLRTVYVHFPDPWFKKRHHKRRVMTPAFLDHLASRLEPGGVLRFMTDFGEYAAEVLELMATRPEFASVPFADLEPRPSTHREEWHDGKQRERIHRHAWRLRSTEA